MKYQPAERNTVLMAFKEALKAGRSEMVMAGSGQGSTVYSSRSMLS
jgi:hypothetical protein